MNQEEAKEFYDSNDRPQLSFQSYYKFSFFFSGENKVMKLFTGYGGNEGDIYRFSVSTNSFDAPATFEALIEQYDFVRITNEATGKEFGWSAL